ncbi:hypothetical protein GLAREA_02554 [Glarea lozoyensis ATCC 20868]|uniref:Uncharacterized protein n=1 Tax=Glarea lozoyensis (strain ATCC 20868 / MF5171) TaxID=1116229 RepID=S3D3J8_GLAL2|nr:uncharacterized protein GLAREA_02554 [Glarea lozoyensis ATCC 20868]EPE26641.1 hypothetical protein GLAREA_02554 [Glarea lozoyensis ATCC 20868]
MPIQTIRAGNVGQHKGKYSDTSPVPKPLILSFCSEGVVKAGTNIELEPESTKGLPRDDHFVTGSKQVRGSRSPVRAEAWTVGHHGSNHNVAHAMQLEWKCADASQKITIGRNPTILIREGPREPSILTKGKKLGTENK